MKPQFLRGQLVEVRSLAEILATLDAQGTLDGLPFMPEMAVFCGRRFRVFRRADKTCVEGYGVRLMGSAVFLEEVRCDGSAHDGCQRNCLIFWREAWLKPDSGASDSAAKNIATSEPPDASRLATQQAGRHFCQSTQLALVTRRMSRWNLQHFLTDYLRGEISLLRFCRILGRMAINWVRKFLGFRVIGKLFGSKQSASKGDLNLLPGEWVEVKSANEIRQTLDSSGKNCGLTFEPDMIEFCGRRFEVDFPIRRIILEESGKMIDLTNTVVLKSGVCQGLCAKNCPRSNPLYWRESWLKRI